MSDLSLLSYTELYNNIQGLPTEQREPALDALIATCDSPAAGYPLQAYTVLEQFPAVNIWNIQRRDVETYLDQLDPKRPRERAVMAECQRVSQQRGSVSMQFEGKSYQVGSEDIAAVVNQKMEATGSKLRVIIAVNADRTVSALCGYLSKERKIDVGGKIFRLLVLDKIVTTRTDISLFGANDYLSNIVVLPATVRRYMDLLYRAKPVRQDYFSEAHAAVYAQVSPANAEISNTDVDLLVELVLVHELEHIRMNDQHGMELRLLEQHLGGETNYLHDVVELRADLGVAQSIIDRASQNPSLAQRQFALWTTLRSPIPLEKRPFVQAMSNVLLASVNPHGADFSVDWTELQQSVTALKGQLDQFCGELTMYVKQGLVGTQEKDAVYLDSRYKGFLLQLRIALEQSKPDVLKGLDARLADGFLRGLAMQRLLESDAQSKAFQEDLMVYASRIEQWMKRHFRLPEAALPFGLPLVIRADELAPR